MDINITRLATSETPWSDYSASQAELGRDAGRLTWGYACEDAQGYALFPESDCDEVRAHFREYGAWDDGELAAMSHAELQALLLQFIAGEAREVPSDHEEFSPEWWVDYQDACERGQVPGQLGRGDDGRVYYYVGS